MVFTDHCGLRGLKSILDEEIADTAANQMIAMLIDMAVGMIVAQMIAKIFAQRLRPALASLAILRSSFVDYIQGLALRRPCHNPERKTCGN